MGVSSLVVEGYIGKLVAIELGFNYYKGHVEKVEDTCAFLRLLTGEQVIIRIGDIITLREVWE